MGDLSVNVMQTLNEELYNIYIYMYIYIGTWVLVYKK